MPMLAPFFCNRLFAQATFGKVRALELDFITTPSHCKCYDTVLEGTLVGSQMMIFAADVDEEPKRIIENIEHLIELPEIVLGVTRACGRFESPDSIVVFGDWSTGDLAGHMKHYVGPLRETVPRTLLILHFNYAVVGK